MSDRKNIRLLLVGEMDFLVPDAVTTGQALGIEFLGPVPGDALTVAQIDQAMCDGAVVDIRYEGEFLFSVMERLGARDLPMVFAFNDQASDVPAGAFVLSPAKDELQAILDRLIQDRISNLH